MGTHCLRVQAKKQETRYLARMGETHRPYSRLLRVQNTISILARNQVGRHRVYPGHYPRIFVAPKNARNAETKRRSGAVPILLLVIPASMTSAYSSLNVLQESNPQPQLLKASVYHSATSAETWSVCKTGQRSWGRDTLYNRFLCEIQR